MQIDPYKVLGIRVDATPEQVKKAFRALMALNHPDQNPGDLRAAEVAKQVSAAHEILKDPKKRARFDNFCHDMESSARGHSSPDDGYVPAGRTSSTGQRHQGMPRRGEAGGTFSPSRVEEGRVPYITFKFPNGTKKNISPHRIEKTTFYISRETFEGSGFSEKDLRGMKLEEHFKVLRGQDGYWKICAYPGDVFSPQTESRLPDQFWEIGQGEDFHPTT